MYKIILPLILSSLLSADGANGKELFNNAKCLECHNSSDFKSKKDKVDTYKKLHKRVKMCAFNTNTAWFDDEVLDVVEYLNSNYYHFKDSKK